EKSMRRSSRSMRRTSIHPSTAMNPEAAVVARSDFDECRTEELDGVLVPELHLRDAPPAVDAHRFSLARCRSSQGTRRPPSHWLDQHGEPFSLSKSLKQRKVWHLIYSYPGA